MRPLILLSMKKLSISFFAILAIVFAVSSAFTTSPKKATTLTNEWYILKSDQLITLANFEASGNPARPINDVDVYEVSDISGSGFAERFTDVQAGLACESEGDYVCSVQLEGTDANSDDEIDATELDEFLQGSPNYVHPAGIFFKSE